MQSICSDHCGRHHTMAAIVPHPMRQGIQQSANMPRNRSMSLKLDVHNMSMTTMWLQETMHAVAHGLSLAVFNAIRFIPWTYWHRLVAWFPQRQQGRQLEHMGRAEATWWGCQNSQFAALMGAGMRAVAKFGNATIPRCRLHGCCWQEDARVFGREQEGAGEKMFPYQWCWWGCWVDPDILMCDHWCLISWWNSTVGACY